MKRVDQTSVRRKVLGFILDSITLGSITVILFFILAVYADPSISAHLVSLTVGAFGVCITSGSAKIVLNSNGGAA